MFDIDALEALAERAQAETTEKTRWWTADDLIHGAKMEDYDAEFVAAASPAAVLDLIGLRNAHTTETPDDAELRRLAEVCQMPDNGPDTPNWWYKVTDLPGSDILPGDAKFIAAARPDVVGGLLDRLAHMADARDAARAEAERMVGLLAEVRATAEHYAGIAPARAAAAILRILDGGQR